MSHKTFEYSKHFLHEDLTYPGSRSEFYSGLQDFIEINDIVLNKEEFENTQKILQWEDGLGNHIAIKFQARIKTEDDHHRERIEFMIQNIEQ